MNVNIGIVIVYIFKVIVLDVNRSLVQFKSPQANSRLLIDSTSEESFVFESDIMVHLVFVVAISSPIVLRFYRCRLANFMALSSHSLIDERKTKQMSTRY